MTVAGAPHPALRVPVLGDGAGSGDWATVRYSPEGVPLLIADAAEYERTIGVDMTAPFGELSFSSMAQVARYLPLALDAGEPLAQTLGDVLANHVTERVALSVDLGCSVGGHLPLLREHSDHVVGVELVMAAARTARALLDGRSLPLIRRLEGRRFEQTCEVARTPIDGVTVVCGNALDPPLFAEVADVVIAMNLLDTVADPLVLLGQMDAVLKPGGLLVLSTPFAWRDDHTPPDRQLGGGTDAHFLELPGDAAVRALLRGELPYLSHLAYDLVDAREVTWTLQETARTRFSYDVHLLAARKKALHRAT